MNMRVIYFHTYGGEISDGGNKKIIAQAENLYKSGIDIRLVLLGGLSTEIPDKKYICLLPCNTYFLKNTLAIRLYRQYLAKKYLKKVINTADSSTILYLRYPLPILVLPYNLSPQRNCKIVFECNSIEINEYKESKTYFSYVWELVFGMGFRKKCDAIIGVTDEITHYQLRRSGNLNKPHITIGNGFDVDSVPIRRPPPYDGLHFDMVCVATVSLWHGIDRLIQGIAQYKGQLNIRLHIVGTGPELRNLENLIRTLNIKDHIIFHGFVKGDDLNRIFDQCHIAVGSLGIHRIGLSQLSILKAREYCARGIPYISACSDPDFPEDFFYILRVPSDESPIDMDQVILFLTRICQVSDHAQTMREYASKNLDWSIKMKKLKGFLETLGKEPAILR
jgi:glycosyltransferase involved in cell wall biosynthesis